MTKALKRFFLASALMLGLCGCDLRDSKFPEVPFQAEKISKQDKDIVLAGWEGSSVYRTNEWKILTRTNEASVQHSLTRTEGNTNIVLPLLVSYIPVEPVIGRGFSNLVLGVSGVRDHPPKILFFEQNGGELTAKGSVNGVQANGTDDGLFAACSDWSSDTSGRHLIKCVNTSTWQIDHVMSVTEADPGSGRSFRYWWITNTHYLVINGHASALGRDRHTGYFELVYNADTRKLYWLSP